MNLKSVPVTIVEVAETVFHKDVLVVYLRPYAFKHLRFFCLCFYLIRSPAIRSSAASSHWENGTDDSPTEGGERPLEMARVVIRKISDENFTESFACNIQFKAAAGRRRRRWQSGKVRATYQ